MSSTHTPHGVLHTYGMDGARLKKNCPPERVRELAGKGATQRQAASALGISCGTFRNNIRDSKSVADAWHEGDGAADNRGRPQVLADEEGTVNLRPGDKEIVLKALGCRKHRGVSYPKLKRMRHLRAITGWDTSVLVASLERLIIHLFAGQIDGIGYTEYVSFTKAGERTKAKASNGGR